MFLVNSDVGPVHSANPRDAATIARWTALSLSSDMPNAPLSQGLGLLWVAAEVTMLHADRTELLRAGDLAVVDRERTLLLSNSTRWTAHLLDLGPRSFTMRIDPRGREIGLSIDGTEPLGRLIKRLWEARDIVDNHTLDEIIDTRIIDLIGDITGSLLSKRRRTGISSHGSAMIARAELLIEAHLADSEFSAAVLARLMRISVRHLSALFATTGKTTTQTILAHRLARAKALLREPASIHQQIAAIAFSSGFNDPNYFTRCFRLTFGVTPRRFRDQAAGLL